MLLVRTGRLGVTARFHLRSIAVTIVLCAAAIGVFAWSLTIGEFSISLPDVATTLRGNGSDEHEFIIRTLRLPRALTGLAVGAAFGLSGAIFQRLTGNALASPVIIGVNAGAAVAAVFAIVVVHAAGTAVTVAALAGSALTAIATYLLAYRRGVTGYRLILVGIGVAAVPNALVQYLLTRAEIYDSQQAVVWLTGSPTAGDGTTCGP
jgi:iron complex transport system permease protein